MLLVFIWYFIEVAFVIWKKIIKKISKYYFYAASGLILICFAAGIQFNPQNKVTAEASNTKNSNQQAAGFKLTNHITSLALNLSSEKTARINSKPVVLKSKVRNKLKLLSNAGSILSTVDFYSSIQKYHYKPKLTDKSNHCCFLI